MTDATDKHYSFDYKGVRIDPYRILDLYKVTHPAQQHAIKKLLRAGQSVKSLTQDIEETIMTLQRWLVMIKEEASPPTGEYLRWVNQVIGEDGNKFDTPEFAEFLARCGELAKAGCLLNADLNALRNKAGFGTP